MGIPFLQYQFAGDLLRFPLRMGKKKSQAQRSGFFYAFIGMISAYDLKSLKGAAVFFLFDFCFFHFEFRTNFSKKEVQIRFVAFSDHFDALVFQIFDPAFEAKLHGIIMYGLPETDTLHLACEKNVNALGSHDREG